MLPPYTAAALFGVLVQSPTIMAEVHDCGQHRSQSAQRCGGLVKADESKKEVNKAKFEAASALPRQEGLVGTAITQGYHGFTSSTSIFDSLSSF